MVRRADRAFYFTAAFAGLIFLSSCSPRLDTPGSRKTAEKTAQPPADRTLKWSDILDEEEEAPISIGPAEGFSFLRAQGSHIVDEVGKPVILRGCNIGNWLLLEMWMLAQDLRDQHEFEEVIATRASREEKDRLMELYRENWITQRDFKIIRSFGFNVIRLPFHHSILEDDRYPFRLKENAFKWLDRAIAGAEQAGLYVILDMHGVPGGQSVDHTTGRAGQNNLYSVAQNQKTAAWLWREIANRYKDSNVVAAYDIINEPFGNMLDNKHREKLIEICDFIYKEIRAVDKEHLIFMPGDLGGVDFYGNPKDRGWENTGLTYHFYPGLMGQELNDMTHPKFMARDVAWYTEYIKELQVPFLVGEFNPVMGAVDTPGLTRKYFDLFAENGWAATMWTYKLVGKEAGLTENRWYLVKNLEPYEPLDIKKADRDAVVQYMQSFKTMKYAVNEELRNALTAENLALDIPHVEPLPMHPPSVDALPAGWAARDINGSRPGGQKVHAKNHFEIFGGGSDIWKKSDQFRFVSKAVSGDFALTATISELLETHQFAKGGLMVRSNNDEDAAFVLIHVFPDGSITIEWRIKDGVDAQEKKFSVGQLPMRLTIRRSGQAVAVSFSEDGHRWEPLVKKILPELPPVSYVGMAVLSHDNRFLSKATFQGIELNGQVVEQ